MTGIGKTMSAVITPDPEVMAVYRKRYTQLWDAADVVRPQPPNGAASPARAVAHAVIQYSGPGVAGASTR